VNIDPPVRYVFDLDGTLCTSSDGDYTNAKPLLDRIAFVNQLFDSGHIVIIHTARGMGRFKNDSRLARQALEELTISQLNRWGVKYSSLFLGKPAGDIYIDDKGIKDVDFFSADH